MNNSNHLSSRRDINVGRILHYFQDLLYQAESMLLQNIILHSSPVSEDRVICIHLCGKNTCCYCMVLFSTLKHLHIRIVIPSLFSSPIKMLTGYYQLECIICYNYFLYYCRRFVPRSGLSLEHWGIRYISRHRHLLVQASTFALLCSCLKEKTLMTGSLFTVS